MCGRFTSLLSPELLEHLFGVQAPQDYPPRYNIAPTQHIWIIRETTSNGRYLSMARWGLVPHWAKDLSIGNRMINTRCETVHEKPAFRQAIRARRCIIPASGFFEWAATPEGKSPHYVTMRDGSPLAFAGIWDSWKTPEGETLETCAILTTTANSLIAKLHDRMPVILHPTELLQEWEVTKVVNNASHESPATIDPAQSV